MVTHSNHHLATARVLTDHQQTVLVENGLAKGIKTEDAGAITMHNRPNVSKSGTGAISSFQYGPWRS
jgi:hypothetical protein